MTAVRRAGDLVALLPAALTVFLSFNAGGFFPGDQALAALALAAVLAVGTLLGPRPLERLKPLGVVSAAALALYAIWTLLSALWSDAPARALLEFDRVLLYLLALVLFTAVLRTPARVELMVRGLGAAFLVVCVAALVTRTLPELWPIREGLETDRLSYPLTYWNSLGLMAALGGVLSLHGTSSARQPPWLRVVSAGAAPVFGAVLLLTFSRGAYLAGAVGVLAYVAAGRPRLLLPGVLAAAPPTVVAALAAYRADVFLSEPAVAISEGRELALVVAGSVAAALILRLLGLAVLDRPLTRLRISAAARRAALAAAAVLAVAGAVYLVAGFDVVSRVSDQYERFAEGDAVRDEGDPRGRLRDLGNNGRQFLWNVAWDEFRTQPLRGHGAGTFSALWAQDRPVEFRALDAHSLYLEVLAELGLVGLALLAVALATMLTALLVRSRGAVRGPYAVLFAMGCAWTLNAGFDWHWEITSVTLWLFAAGGAGLAARRSAPADLVAFADERRETSLAEAPRPAAVGAVAAGSASWGGGEESRGAQRPGADGDGRPEGSGANSRRSWMAPAGLSPRLRALVALGWVVLAATPALIALSQARLEEALAAFNRGDCTTAIDRALASNAALSVRPEPFEVLGYCDARRDLDELSVQMFENAVRRDPLAWELRYGLALARGTAGRDPLPALRSAARLNPKEPIVRDALERFDAGDSPRMRERKARRAPLPVS